MKFWHLIIVVSVIIHTVIVYQFCITPRCYITSLIVVAAVWHFRRTTRSLILTHHKQNKADTFTSKT